MPDPDPLPRLFVKPGVDLNGLAPGGARILSIVAIAPLILGFPLTITCGREGHGPDDPHTHGNALDLRTKDLTPTQLLAAHSYFVQQMGTDLFTTLYEVPIAARGAIDPALQALIYAPSDPTAEHFHLQVRKGRLFPSPARSV